LLPTTSPTGLDKNRCSEKLIITDVKSQGTMLSCAINRIKKIEQNNFIIQMLLFLFSSLIILPENMDFTTQKPYSHEN
jgi:hypothetical protein